MALELRPTAISVFTPYKAVAGDRRFIRNHDEHRNFLREFGYEEVGNDSSMAPPDLDVSEAEYESDRKRKVADLERNVKDTNSILGNLADNL